MKRTTDINYRIISESYLRKYLYFFYLNERRGITNNIIILVIFSVFVMFYSTLSFIDGNILYVIGSTVAIIGILVWWICCIVNAAKLKKVKKEAEHDIFEWNVKKICILPNEYYASPLGNVMVSKFRQFKLRLLDTKEDFYGRDIGNNKWIKYFGDEIEITYLKKSKLIVLIEKKNSEDCSDFETNFSNIINSESPYKSPTPVMFIWIIILLLCTIHIFIKGFFIVTDKINRYNAVDSNRNAVTEYVEKYYGDDFYIEDYEVLDNLFNTYNISAKDTFMVYSGDKLPPFKVAASNGKVCESEYYAVYSGQILNEKFVNEFFPTTVSEEQYISRCVAVGHTESVYVHNKDVELIESDKRKISYLLVIFVDKKPDMNNYEWIYSLNHYVYNKYNITKPDFRVFFMDAKIKDVIQNEFNKNTIPDLASDYQQYIYLTLNNNVSPQ